MRCELVVATCAALLASAACRTPEPTRPRPVVPPAPLLAPGPVDPKARGAALLTQLGAQIQPAWGQFLEDCRTRLPADHALNTASLVATAELAVDRTGRITLVALASSGNADFDRAVRGVVRDASVLDAPASDLVSDDDLVHVRWLFARDRRQAGPATAELFIVDLPLAQVIERWLARGELARAAARLARAPASDTTRNAAIELVLHASLRYVLTAGSSAEARRGAVEAIGRARIASLAPEVRRLVSPTTASELRLAAMATAAALADRNVIDELARSLEVDLASSPPRAIAAARTLVALGETARVESAVRRALERPTPSPAALAALAVVSLPALDGKLATWFGRGDARVRAAVCTAITRSSGRALAERGLRDADATVRAACLDAIARIGLARSRTDVLTRMRQLARDRDQSVRAHAVAALAAVQGGSLPGATEDPAAEVRVAAVRDAREAQLLALVDDPDPDVRAAVVTRLGPRDPAAVARAATDPASQVRRAAIASVSDEATLERLAGDDAPEVAREALVALVNRRGRTASATGLLARLAAGPSDAERVRIALAWLLATQP
ncbi:MAG: hypothetical protein SFX73_20075 [Kofleriaceae bacterium]|nr:hypothetical protein [Kofleriaceae bacterium]